MTDVISHIDEFTAILNAYKVKPVFCIDITASLQEGKKQVWLRVSKHKDFWDIFGVGFGHESQDYKIFNLKCEEYDYYLISSIQDVDFKDQVKYFFASVGISLDSKPDGIGDFPVLVFSETDFSYANWGMIKINASEIAVKSNYFYLNGTLES